MVGRPLIVDWADGVKLVKNILVPIREGVSLAADLYVPDEQWETERHPVVLEYRPYRKDDELVPGSRFYERLVREGYLVARVDIRGTGASEGVSIDEYTMEEQLDGCDVVEWVAAQPWCDGHVNLVGTSYSAFTAVQIASHQPAGLTSIVPIYFTDDRYTDDCHYWGGLMRQYFDPTLYGIIMMSWNALPPYPEWSGGDWARIWEQHLEGNEPYILQWMRNQLDGPYWWTGSVRHVDRKITCPVFMIGGWRDGYPNPPLRLYERLDGPRKVLIGPWDHFQPDRSILGPRIDHVHEIVRWLDYWCKGAANGVMEEPPIAIYMQRHQTPLMARLETKGEWRAETQWPPEGAGDTVLHFGAASELTEDVGESGRDELEYVPTVGLSAGLYSYGFPGGLAGDQRADEVFSLVYTTPPLDRDTAIFGRPRGILHIDSTAPVIGFCISLSEVGPDGSSCLVSKGMLNATRRDSLTEPTPLRPGEVYELKIELDTTAWKFRAGNRIRVAVANANWPNVWPTPYLATSNVYRGAARPSRIILPAVPVESGADTPTLQPSPRSLTPPWHEVEPPTWEIVEDGITGRRRVNLRQETKHRVNETTVVERLNHGVSEVNPRDPASASQTGGHVTRIVRPSGTIEAESRIAIQATATHFHVMLDLEVRNDGVRTFFKNWVESIQRILL